MLGVWSEGGVAWEKERVILFAGRVLCQREPRGTSDDPSPLVGLIKRCP